MVLRLSMRRLFVIVWCVSTSSIQVCAADKSCRVSGDEKVREHSKYKSARMAALVALSAVIMGILDLGIRGKKSLIGRLFDNEFSRHIDHASQNAPAPSLLKPDQHQQKADGKKTPEQIIMCMSNQNSPPEAFSIIMGATEQDIDQKIKAAFKKAGKKYPEDVADALDLVYQAAPPPQIVTQGTHEVLTIEQLEAACENAPLFNRDNRKFQCITGSVADLQADKAYRDAVFQIASTSSGIEGSVSYGGSVSGLSSSPQGQTAGFSALGRAIYSMRYRKRINLKEHYTRTINDKDAYKKLAIDLHTDVQVTKGESEAEEGRKVPNYLNPQQRITQVLTFAYANPDKNNLSHAAQARDYLKAAYQGTLLAAVAKGKKKVVLTLMGGGVFSNPFSWIGVAIKDCEGLIIKYNLDVVLVLYNLHEFKDAAATTEKGAFYREMLAFEQKMKNASAPS